LGRERNIQGAPGHCRRTSRRRRYIRGPDRGWGVVPDFAGYGGKDGLAAASRRSISTRPTEGTVVNPPEELPRTAIFPTQSRSVMDPTARLPRALGGPEISLRRE